LQPCCTEVVLVARRPFQVLITRRGRDPGARGPLAAASPKDGPARYLLSLSRQRLFCPAGEADMIIRLASK
jgi:hypothetical protein